MNLKQVWSGKDN